MTGPLWAPSDAQCALSNMTHLMAEADDKFGLSLADYEALHNWSIERPEEFWTLVWDACGVIGERGSVVVEDFDQMPGARWFPKAQLNYAENLLRPRAKDTEAIVFRSEKSDVRRLTYADLCGQVAQLRQALVIAGVAKGDRVVAYMPNIPETVIAMLAAASLGVVFSSASPDFGAKGALERFSQVEPKVLFATDGYFYNGKLSDTRDKLRDIAASLPTLEQVFVVPFVTAGTDALSDIPKAKWWADALAPFDTSPLDFERVSFDHPLFIMFSSGTTGVPKCIVHSHGGALLQHLKEHRYHCDINPGDRVFYFTTCGWMMWNWLVSALASKATLMLYDGSPFHPDGTVLFDYATQERITLLGVSAKWIDAIKKAKLRPKDTHDLSNLRTICSTGSPLMAESFDFVYEAIKDDVHLASIAGGTDILSCFVGGNPLAPVYRGEIQVPALAMAVSVFDDEGKLTESEKGELVCTQPFPSMPVGFWNDPDGLRYRAAYFEKFLGVWAHGDLIKKTDHGGYIIYGRSDATLNPGGVRIGTAEIYRQVEQLDEIVEAIVVGQNWDSDTRVVLFVVLRRDLVLDENLIAKIKTTIRANATPRHVPSIVLQVQDIPRTKSGKIVELAVRNIVHGRPVKNIEALANPEALDHFKGLAALGR